MEDLMKNRLMRFLANVFALRMPRWNLGFWRRHNAANAKRSGLDCILGLGRPERRGRWCLFPKNCRNPANNSRWTRWESHHYVGCLESKAI